MSQQSFCPLDDRVLIEPVEPITQSPGGIILPDIAKEKPQRGHVRAVGPGKVIEFTGDRSPMTVQIGMEVLFAKYSGAEVELGEKIFVVQREADILGIIGNGEQTA